MHLKTNNFDITYLTIEDVLLIHTGIITETGGFDGVRDIGRVQGIMDHPKQIVFGKELRETIFQKAAAYGHDIIKYHPFVDGNKRTGMTAMGVFLLLNGFQIDVPKGEIEKMALLTIEDKLEIEDIAQWLEKNSKEI